MPLVTTNLRNSHSVAEVCRYTGCSNRLIIRFLKMSQKVTYCFPQSQRSTDSTHLLLSLWIADREQSSPCRQHNGGRLFGEYNYGQLRVKSLSWQAEIAIIFATLQHTLQHPAKYISSQLEKDPLASKTHFSSCSQISFSCIEGYNMYREI